jgi:hypothetical protein
MNIASAKRSRQAQQAAADRTFLLILIAGTIIVLGALVLGNWAAGRPAPAAQAIAPAGLLPLAEPVNPVTGYHTMERMPNPSAAPRQVAAGTPQAKVDLPLTRWDWGTIPVRPPVKQTFPIQNRGDKPLIISNVVTSCGCTTAELTSSVIPPGQRADLVVTFDPAFHETSGPVTRLVWLETNDPAMPVVELRMDANVTPS